MIPTRHKGSALRRSWMVRLSGIVLLAGAGGVGWLLNLSSGLLAPPIGGPFNLVDETGKGRTDADFRGRFMLVYFGYTHCPDACPTTLQDIADALAKLGTAADQIVPIFITIDPTRDTVQYRP